MSQGSRELLKGIGGETSDTAVDSAALDALEVLKSGAGNLAGESLEAQRQLIDKLRFAMPEWNQRQTSQERGMNVGEALYEVVGRLRPMLAAMVIMSDAAAGVWDNQVKKGTHKDAGANHLFRLLVTEFRILFGRWPETTWRGSGHIWMHELIKRAAAGVETGAPSRPGSSRGVDRAPTLPSLLTEIQPSKYKSQARQAALEHRIRKGVAQAKDAPEGKAADRLPRQAKCRPKQ